MRQKFYAWIISLALLIVFTFTLVGCGVSNTTSNQQQSNAEKYPNGPVTVLVPFAPGSTVDVEARLLARILQKELGQPFVVENKTAGSGAEALDTMMNRPADGQTMLIHTRTFTFLFAGKRVPYTLSNVIPVARLVGEPSAFFVRKDSPYKTMADLVKAAKDKPGSITIGGPGVQSINQEVAMEVEQATGMKLNWIPFSGGSLVVNAVLGGHVNLGAAAASNALAEVKGGQMRYLGIAADSRLSGIDAPTFKEQGINVSETVWRGAFMRAGTPQYKVEIMAKALKEALQDPSWKDFAQKHSQIEEYLGPDQFPQYLSSEVSKTATFLQQFSTK